MKLHDRSPINTRSRRQNARFLRAICFPLNIVNHVDRSIRTNQHSIETHYATAPTIARENETEVKLPIDFKGWAIQSNMLLINFDGFSTTHQVLIMKVLNETWHRVFLGQIQLITRIAITEIKMKTQNTTIAGTTEINCNHLQYTISP